MSTGSGQRHNRRERLSATGVKTADILNNLSQTNNELKNLSNETFSKEINYGLQKTGFDRNSGAEGAQRKAAFSERDDFKQSVTDISEDEITNLNLSFQQRSNEILQRNAFRGSDQLILTDRNE